MSDDCVPRQVDSAKTASLLGCGMILRKVFPLVRARSARHAVSLFIASLFLLARSAPCLAQADPASEPAVLAVAKVLPAVVNINTERVVRRTVRDPFEDF